MNKDAMSQSSSLSFLLYLFNQLTHACATHIKSAKPIRTWQVVIIRNITCIVAAMSNITLPSLHKNSSVILKVLQTPRPVLCMDRAGLRWGTGLRVWLRGPLLGRRQWRITLQ